MTFKNGKAPFSERVPADTPVHRVALHSDLITTSTKTIDVLAGRGISDHFLIDGDGTVLQLGDPADHATTFPKTQSFRAGRGFRGPRPLLAVQLQVLLAIIPASCISYLH